MGLKLETRSEGDAQALHGWQKPMGFNYDVAAAALGISISSYAWYVAKSNPLFMDLARRLLAKR